MSLCVISESPRYPGTPLFQVNDSAEFYQRYSEWVSRFLIINELFMLEPFIALLEQDGWQVVVAESARKIQEDYERWSQPLDIDNFQITRSDGTPSELFAYQRFTLNRALERSRASSRYERMFFFGFAAGAGKSAISAAGAQELFNRGQVDLVLAFTLKTLRRSLYDFFTGTTGLYTCLLDGTPAKRRKLYEEGFQAIILNYDKAHWDQEHLYGLVEGKRVLYVMDEALALDTPILTRDRGWQTIDTVMVGDFVPGSCGWVRVKGKTAVFDHEKCYEVSFQGGDQITCSANHIWTVLGARHQGRCRDDFEVRTSDLPVILKAAKHWNRALAVPVPDGVEYPHQELPIDPYLLGYWLGDGDRTASTISVHADDRPHLRERLAKSGYIITSEWDKGVYITREGATTRGGDSFRSQLIELGVLGNKHIPDIYLRSARAQRLELLRGLMDSDGHAYKTSTATFTQRSGPLLEATQELIRSLGIHFGQRVLAQGAIHTDTPATQLVWVGTTDLNPFSLPRKRDRITKVNKVVSKKITDIKEATSVPVQCLEVEAEDHLFAVGRQWTLTHNCHKILTDAGKTLARKGMDKLVKASDTPIVWPMTASAVQETPLNYRDVFNLDGMNSNPLGSKAQFEEDYLESKRTVHIPTKWGGSFPVTYYKWDNAKLQNIRHRVADRTQSVRKTDPGVKENFMGLQTEVIHLELSSEDRRLYEVVKSRAEEAKAKELSVEPYYRIMRYICNTPESLQYSSSELAQEYVECYSSLITSKNSSKMETMIEQVKGIRGAGDKVVIFTQWTKMSLFLIAAQLRKHKINFVEHYGQGMTDSERDLAVSEFKTNKNITVFLSSDAGAHGLSFQMARYVINYDTPFSYDTLNQRQNRIDRADSYLDGLTSYVYVTADTIEERIWQKNNQRRELASATLGTQEVLSYTSESDPETIDWLIFGK